MSTKKKEEEGDSVDHLDDRIIVSGADVMSHADEHQRLVIPKREEKERGREKREDKRKKNGIIYLFLFLSLLSLLSFRNCTGEYVQVGIRNEKYCFSRIKDGKVWKGAIFYQDPYWKICRNGHGMNCYGWNFSQQPLVFIFFFFFLFLFFLFFSFLFFLFFFRFFFDFFYIFICCGKKNNLILDDKT